MNLTTKKRTLAICECGMLLALAFVIDWLSKLIIPSGVWVAGGGITLGI